MVEWELTVRSADKKSPTLGENDWRRPNEPRCIYTFTSNPNLLGENSDSRLAVNCFWCGTGSEVRLLCHAWLALTVLPVLLSRTIVRDGRGSHGHQQKVPRHTHTYTHTFELNNVYVNYGVKNNKWPTILILSSLTVCSTLFEYLCFSFS